MGGVLEQISERLASIEALLKKGPVPGTVIETKDDDADDEPAPAAAKKRTRSPAKPEKTLTLAQVKDKLKVVLEKKGRKAAVALLEEFDAEKVGDLDEASYSKFAAACDAALDGDDEDMDL